MNVLLLFTHSFPYTLEEKTFLEPELKYLSQAFDKVIIIPRNVKGDCLLELPENVSVSHHEIYFPYNRLNVLIKNIPLLIRIIFYELYFSKNRLQYIKNGWKMLQHLLLVISNADRLKKTIEEECDQTDSIVCYSYWFAIWGDILPILKLKSSLIKKVVSRAHGYDVYEFQRKGRFFPFRSFNLSVLDQIYCISENGRNYMASSYSKFSEKIKLSRLGVDGIQNKLTKVPDDIVHIVSCSSVYDLKRVHLILDILRHMKNKVVWSHFGGGELMGMVEEASENLPDNIHVNLMGEVENKVVMDFYKENPVDFFINVSESEGIPVSMMEAICFGIPIIATNVGGVSEIVTERTGVLIDKDFDSMEVSIILEKNISRFRDINLRNEIKEFWQENYSSDKNYNDFVKKLKN